jgi:branched-chain amino acid transport system ATP-binding protein
MSLQINGLNVYYGDSQALWGVDLEIPTGGLVSLVGANGAGKTTLMRAIVGLTPARSGTVELDGVQILGLPPERRVQQGIALVPEGRRLFKGLSVQENLLLGAYARKDRSAIAGDLEKVVGYMPDLEPILDRLAGDLSGGQQQMCAVGRALMAKPRVLLVDEMSLGLAPVVVDRIADTLQRINRESGISILIVEQDVELSLSITQTAYVLETGHVVTSGTSSELRQRDDIQAAYLGLH